MRDHRQGWRIYISKHAQGYIARLMPRDRDRILSAIDALATDPHAGRAHQLVGRSEWTLRIGNRRIIFDLCEQDRLIVILRIGPRGDVYSH